MATTYHDVATLGRAATDSAQTLQRLKRGLVTAQRTIREDPSLKVTADGRVEAKSVAELRRLYPELPLGDLGTIHREAVAAAAAYTADEQTPKQFPATAAALDAAIGEALARTRGDNEAVTVG